MKVRKAVLLLLALFAVSCANGPCHPLRHPELQQKPPVTPDGAANSGGEAVVAGEGRVFVAKPDGSLQCGMAKGETPAEMEKQLGGIKVYSRVNRPDGKMHIQVCGSPTGQVNVYEIPNSSLSEAEKRGFTVFTP
jgi:hypothetical protein